MKRFSCFVLLTLVIFGCGVGNAQAQPPEFKAILEDFGLTEADVQQLGININGRMQEYQGKFEDRFKEPPTKENYREKVGQVIDELGPKMTGILREELRDFLTPEQYQKAETRVLQFHTSMLNELETSENPEVFMASMPAGMLQMAMGPPSFLEFTEDQKQKLLELQKRTILDGVGAGLDLESQMKDEKLSETDRIAIVFKKLKPIFVRFKKEYEKILTDKQRAQIEEIMKDMPDYLWNALPQNKGKEREWRPGANSWKPGDGAPENVETGAEARPSKPRGDRPFPGGN